MPVEVVWQEVLKAREAWMNLVTQMALNGTRASEAWERQVQPQLEPQSRHMYLTLQDLAEMPCPAWADRTWQGLVDMPCLGQVDNSCQGWVGPLSQDQVDVWRQGLVVHCPRVKRTCWTMTWWTCCIGTWWPCAARGRKTKKPPFQFVSYLKRGKGLDQGGMGLL